MPALWRFSCSACMLLVACVAIIGGGHLSAGEPFPEPVVQISGLEVTPARVTLNGPDAVQRVVVTGLGAGQSACDLTRQATYEISAPGVARVDARGILTPDEDGDAVLLVRVGSHAVQVPVTVSGAKVQRVFNFRNEIIPVLTKGGCNSGGCHGKASGQNGFKLSVFGFDLAADYEALLGEGRGRRTFLAAPEQSLLLRKACGQMPHGGGVRFNADSYAYRTLRDWIAAGAPVGSGEDATVVGLEVWPAERELTAGGQQQLLATAIYSDGARRDVTAQAEYSSNVEPIAGVDEAGLIQATEVPGEAAIMVRYMGEVAVSRVIRPLATNAEFPATPSNNFIDDLVWAKLRKLKIFPSELCTDAEFLRRVSIDTIGTLPTPDEARRFLDSADPAKRSQLIDALLSRPEFADYWALRWGDVLRVDSAAITQKGAYVFHQWLRQAVASDLPYDRMVRAILTAQGDATQSGPVNLYRAVKTPEELANTVSQVFLGIRIECAQCHHHPYERWGQDDFYGLAAYFTQLKRKVGARGQDVLFAGGGGEIKHPLTKQVVPPHPLGQPAASGDDTGDRRRGLAEWLTARDNPYLARMVANRIWAHYLGRGIVDPVDDVRTTNPASNEPLLAALSRYTVEQEFDLRKLMRVILNSRVYQLSSRAQASNALDSQNFSHAPVKGLPAEVLLDAVSQATEVPEKFEGRPLGTRAIQLWDNRLPSYFLEIFGKPVRASVCECERSGEPSMTQALHLLNSPGIERKVAHAQGRVRRLLDANVTNAQLAEEMYLATLSRRPTDQETQAVSQILDAASERRRAAEDVLWALLNSTDFVFNH